IQPGSTSQSGVRYGWGSRTTLRAPDVQAILKECPAIAYATPSLRGGFQVVYANQNWPTAGQGTGVEYLNIFDWPLASGEWLTSQDIGWCPSIACMQYIQRAHARCYPPEARNTIHLKSAPSVLVVKGWQPAIRVSKRRNSHTRCAPSLRVI